MPSAIPFMVLGLLEYVVRLHAIKKPYFTWIYWKEDSDRRLSEEQ